MLSVRLLAAACVLGSVACASAPEGAFVRFPPERPSAFDGAPHATLGAAIDIPAVPAPLLPLSTLSGAIALYEAGEPPPSIPAMTELYRQVCADADRTRARRSAYESGDEIARRQDCYCEDSMPCSANRDCSDLVVCHPQLALSDVADARSSRL